MVALLKMPGTLRFPQQSASNDGGSPEDRRMFPRKEIHARVEGRRLDHTIDARQNPQLKLALRDLSLGGLSAIAQAPLAAGERLNVFFPANGISRGWDAYGRVIRCQPSSMGYRVAVEFDPLPAA
jgi:hypothetical protein